MSQTNTSVTMLQHKTRAAVSLAPNAAEDNLSGSIVLTQYIQRGEPRVDMSPPATRKVYWGRNKPSLEYFFLPFLTKTKREQPLPSHVYCEIWPPILVMKF